jgi:hypothetical protein
LKKTFKSEEAEAMEPFLNAVRAGDSGALSKLLTSGVNFKMTDQVFDSVLLCLSG